MKQNVIYWIGINNPGLSKKYNNFEYFEYSKNTWKYWCKKNNCVFVEFNSPVEPDMLKFRVNWQKAIFVFDKKTPSTRKISFSCFIISDILLVRKLFPIERR